MISQIKMGAILSYANIFLGLIIGLGYTPIMLKLLGQDEYGVYSLIGALVAYLNVLDMGLGKTIIRYISRNRVIGDKKSESDLNGLFLIVYTIIGIISLFVGGILYYNIENLFGNTLNIKQMYEAKIMMILLVLNISISFPLSIFASIMQSYEKYIFLKMSNLLSNILRPIISLPLLFWGFGAISLVIVASILNIGCLLIYVYYCLKKLDIHISLGKYNRTFLIEIAGFSFFIFLNAIMDKIYWGTGQFILGMISNVAQVAIYSIAMQFMAMYMGFSGAISNVLLPKVTILVSKGCGARELTDLMIKVGRLQFIIVGYVFIMFFLVGEEFLFLWAGNEYVSAYLMIIILMIAMLPPLVQNTGIAILQAMNLNRYRMTVYTIIAIINLFTSYVLASYYNGLGCAISSGIAIFISTGWIMNNYYKNKIGIDTYLFWKNIVFMMPSMFILIIIVYFINCVSSLQSTWLIFSIKSCIYTLIYFLLMYNLSMNDYEKGLVNKIFYKVGSIYKGSKK